MDELKADAAGTGSANSEAVPGRDLAALIEHWWNEHFPGSAVARVTAAWNHAFAAKETLKRLVGELETRQGGQ